MSQPSGGSPLPPRPPSPPLVVVVGAGPGLGAAVARRFLREGYAAALIARDASRLDDLAGSLGGPARGFPADVSDAPSLRNALTAARDWGGDPAVAVHNPSVFVPGRLDEVDLATYEKAVAIGVTAFVVLLQWAVPIMTAAGHGTVLATGGGLALKPAAGAATLSGQKAALRALVISSAKDLAPLGLRVATVTVDGVLGDPGTEPDQVAEHYWTLHRQDTGAAAEYIHRAPTP